MREFFSSPTVPTFANPGCWIEHHPPDQEEWEEVFQPTIDWILDLLPPQPIPENHVLIPEESAQADFFGSLE